MALAITTLIVQFSWIATPKTAQKEFFKSNSTIISSAEKVVVNVQIPQDHTAYLNMFNPRTSMHDLFVEGIKFHRGSLFYLDTTTARNWNMNLIAQNGKFCLAKYE